MWRATIQADLTTGALLLSSDRARMFGMVVLDGEGGGREQVPGLDEPLACRGSADGPCSRVQSSTRDSRKGHT